MDDDYGLRKTPASKVRTLLVVAGTGVYSLARKQDYLKRGQQLAKLCVILCHRSNS